MDNRIWKKSAVTAAALLVASAKVPADRVLGFVGGGTLEAGAEELSQFPFDDFDQAPSDQETLETVEASYAADADKEQLYSLNVADSAHGRVEARMWKGSTELTERRAGGYVELKVYPEEGYYLKDIKLVTDSTEKILRYDETDSLGFYMPAAELTVVPEFAELSYASETVPEYDLYRVVKEYKDGECTGKELYVPISIEGVNETYNKGEKPELIVKSADGLILEEGVDYTIDDNTREKPEGIEHTLMLTGTNGPSKDAGNYFTGSSQVVKSLDFVKYFEYTDEVTAVLYEGSNDIKLNEHYYFTPDEDGEYSFSYTGADDYNIMTYTETDIVRQTKKDFKLKLEAGRTYHFTGITANDYNNKASVGLEIHKVGADKGSEKSAGNIFSITKQASEYGRIETARYTRENEDVNEREKGKYVDVHVFPDQNCYLKDIKFIADNGETVKWYEDSSYGLGFKMPASNVTVVPEFAEYSSDISSNVPEDGMYRETAVFSNGKRTSDKVYIPVKITGINESYEHGQKPEYTVMSADDDVLGENTHYTVSETTEETEDGILHTLTFKGNGKPAMDSEGCYSQSRYYLKGEQTVTYLEKNEADKSVLSKDHSNKITINSDYTFTPDEDGVYRFTYTDTDDVNVNTFINTADDTVGIRKNNTFDVELKAGKTYKVGPRVRKDQVVENNAECMLTIEKMAAHNITAIADNGTLLITNTDTTTQRSIAAEGDTLRVKVLMKEGYTFKGLTVTTAEGENVETTRQNSDHIFTMPGSDVTVKAEYEKVQAQQEVYSITRQAAEHGSIETIRYGYDEKVNERRPGGAVDVKVSPDEGYYLKDIKFVAENGDTVRFYDNDYYGLGFEMPASAVTVVPEFAKITADMSYVAPTEGLYREVPEYRDGKRTGRKIYIPVVVDGVVDGKCYSFDETFPYRKDDITVRTVDGYVLKEGFSSHGEFVLAEYGEKEDKNMIEVKGKGDHELDSDGYVTGSYNVIKGEKTIIFYHKNSDKTANIEVIDFKGNKTAKEVIKDEFELPEEKVEGYKAVGWKINGGTYVYNKEDAVNFINMKFYREPTQELLFTIETVYEKLPEEEAKQQTVRLIEVDFYGKKTVKNVNLNDYTLPEVPELIEAGDEYKFFGWKIGDNMMVTSQEDALAQLRLAYASDPKAAVTVQPVYDTYATPDPDVEETPVQENADFTVTYGEAKDQHYSDYSTGGNIFVMDFSFNNLNSSKIKGGVIEFEFDAPVGKFKYGADIGQRNVTVDPTDPRKVTVEFSTYDPNGSSANALNSYLAISAANKGQSLNCIGARVVSVAQ